MPHPKIIETNDKGRFLANTQELFPLPSSGGYDRLHKSWRKTVTGLDKGKTNGYSLLGDFVKDGPQWFAPGLYLACAWRGSVKNQSPYYALYRLTVTGDVETIADVDGGRDWAVKLWPVIEEALAAFAAAAEQQSAAPAEFTDADRLDLIAKLSLKIQALAQDPTVDRRAFFNLGESIGLLATRPLPWLALNRAQLEDDARMPKPDGLLAHLRDAVAAEIPPALLPAAK